MILDEKLFINESNSKKLTFNEFVNYLYSINNGYHAFSKVSGEKGSGYRYTLSNKLTQEQKDYLAQYPNVQIGSATYKYAPEQKYDTVILLNRIFKVEESKVPRYTAKEVNGKGYIYDRNFSNKVPSNVDKDIETARKSVDRWNKEESLKEDIKEQYIVEIQPDTEQELFNDYAGALDYFNARVSDYKKESRNSDVSVALYKVVDDEIIDTLKYWKKDETLKEEYGSYKDEPYCEEIANELENGVWFGETDNGTPWELTINGLSKNEFSPAFAEYLAEEEVSYPVRDGHLAYIGIEMILYKSNMETIFGYDELDKLIPDLIKLNLDRETIDEWLSSSDPYAELITSYNFDIAFDVDEWEDNNREDVDLPTEVTYDFYSLVDDDVDINSDDYNLDDVISDRLSDDYGYTHYGFEYDVDKDSGDVYVYDIKWDISESLNKFDKSLKESKNYTHFTYKSGANPYIAKTNKEAQRILNKYKGKVKETKKGFYEIDDTKEDTIAQGKAMFTNSQKNRNFCESFDNKTILDLTIFDDNKIFEKKFNTIEELDNYIREISGLDLKADNNSDTAFNKSVISRDYRGDYHYFNSKNGDKVGDVETYALLRTYIERYPDGYGVSYYDFGYISPYGWRQVDDRDINVIESSKSHKGHWRELELKEDTFITESNSKASGIEYDGYVYFFDDEAEKLSDVLTLKSMQLTDTFCNKVGISTGKHTFTSLPLEKVADYRDRVTYTKLGNSDITESKVLSESRPTSKDYDGIEKAVNGVIYSKEGQLDKLLNKVIVEMEHLYGPWEWQPGAPDTEEEYRRNIRNQFSQIEYVDEYINEWKGIKEGRTLVDLLTQIRNILDNDLPPKPNYLGDEEVNESVLQDIQSDSIEHDFEDITNMSDARERLKKYGIDLIKKDNRNYILRKDGKKYTFYVLSNPNEVRKDLVKAVHKLIESSNGRNMKENIGSDIAEYQKWVDYDMKKYGRISSLTNHKIKKAGLKIVKDKYGDYEVIANEPIEEKYTLKQQKVLDAFYKDMNFGFDSNKVTINRVTDNSVEYTLDGITSTYKPGQDLKEDLEREFTIHYNREGFEFGGYGAVRVKATDEDDAKEKFFAEKKDNKITIASIRPTTDEDVRKGIRLLDTKKVEESLSNKELDDMIEISHKIGLNTLDDLQDFLKRQQQPSDATIIDTLKRYSKEFDESKKYAKKTNEDIDFSNENYLLKPYWYSTTHGVTVGSIPKNVKVWTWFDGNNKSFFATSDIISTEDLKEYEIKEETPNVEDIPEHSRIQIQKYLEQPLTDNDMKISIKAQKVEEDLSADTNPIKPKDTGLAQLLIDAINGEWETIQLYNDISINANNEKIAEIIKQINADEYTHVGLLQTALDLIAPNTNTNLEKGNEQADEIIDNKKEKVEDVQ